ISLCTDRKIKEVGHDTSTTSTLQPPRPRGAAGVGFRSAVWTAERVGAARWPVHWPVAPKALSSRCGQSGALIRCSSEVSIGSRRRSEEHTSELQSLAYLVCRLLLEKKKK